MSGKHFLVRNRHNNIWYGRVVIPHALRPCFNGQKEIRRSLRTSDKKQAKFLSMELRVQCQKGFERLALAANGCSYFKSSKAFLDWLTDDRKQGVAPPMKLIKLDLEYAGSRSQYVIDLDDPKEEARLALQLQANAHAFMDQFKDDPDTLQRLTRIKDDYRINDKGLPETAMPFDEAADIYIDKLKNQGRKGKKLSQRTLINYEGRLEFWKEHFGKRPVHEILLKELGEVQDWLPWLRPNYKKRGMSTKDAVNKAQTARHSHDRLSDKTTAEYLGQLKGILEFCYSRGFITNDLARHIELPNTKQSRSVERLPFTLDDLNKIFPGADYGVDFGRQSGGIDRDSKFWFPLLAVFSGARLEELAQLKTTDIKTCPDTGILYMMVDNKGLAGDGEAKHTKNSNSVRPIPIHFTLLNIGFMGYVDKRQADKKDQSLFKLKRDKQGRLAKGLSNWFSRLDQRTNGKPIKGYIERRGVEGRGIDENGQKWTKSFHSFRHTVIDNLRGKKMANGEYIREQDIALVVGHDKEKLETANYGANRTQLELRRDIVEAIAYEGVGFGEIKF